MEDGSHPCADRPRSFSVHRCRDSVLCLDHTKEYYFTMTDNELVKCKLVEPTRYVCAHQHTLLSAVAT